MGTPTPEDLEVGDDAAAIGSVVRVVEGQQVLIEWPEAVPETFARVKEAVDSCEVPWGPRADIRRCSLPDPGLRGTDGLGCEAKTVGRGTGIGRGGEFGSSKAAKII
jgi:hypothetical protein